MVALVGLLMKKGKIIRFCYYMYCIYASFKVFGYDLKVINLCIGTCRDGKRPKN